MITQKYDVIIIGSGPASYVAGIYTAIARHKTLIIETQSKDSATYQNFDKVAGVSDCKTKEDFIKKLREQTKRFDVVLVDSKIKNIILEKKKILIEIDGCQYESISLIIDDLEVLSSFFGNNLHLIDKRRGLSNVKNIFICGRAANCIPEAIVLCGSGCIAAKDSNEYLSSR